MFCANCGKEINLNAKFCSGCGQKTVDNASEINPTYNDSRNEKSGFIGFCTNLYRGRLGRLDYFLGGLFLFLSASIPFTVLPLFTMNSNDENFLIGVAGIWMIFVFIFSISLITRRFHDMNMSGFWIFILLVPIVSLIYHLILLLQGGTASANNFGQANDKRGFIKRVLNL